jgi:hypothetical protein
MIGIIIHKNTVVEAVCENYREEDRVMRNSKRRMMRSIK